MQETWVKFFTEAGIPDSAAATYALTFVENRIQTNMLLELNKEYLKDMGITLMGDVIAILRHAKNVHEQEAREKVLSTSPSITPASSTGDLLQENEEDVISSKKSSPGFRVNSNDHSMHKEGTLSHEKEIKAIQPATFTVRVPEKKKRAIAQVKCQPTTVHPYQSDDEEMDLVDKDFYVPASAVPTTVPTVTGKPSTRKKAKTIIANKKASLEHTTLSKKTVFERLGRETSNTPVASAGPDSVTKGVITITCNSASLNTRNSAEKKSVFSRLGSKTDDVTTPDVAKVSPEGPALPYAGILKPTTQTATKKKVVKKLITMRADEPKVPVHLRAESTKSRTAIKKKVPVQVITKRTAAVSNKTNTQGILGNYVSASKVNIKQRLGTSQTYELPKKQVICIEKEEYEDDSEILDTDSSADGFSTEGLQSKKVTFGGVTQKSIPSRLSLSTSVEPVGQGSITMTTGVFSRLGMSMQ